MHVGCGQITWREVPEADVLTDISVAGYEGAAPKLVPPRSAEETLRVYAEYGLVAAPPYLGAPFWEREQRERIVARAREVARFAKALGCTELYVAAHGPYETRSGKTRQDVAGHVGSEDGLDDLQWATLTATLNAVGEATLQEGVRACFHNHVGTVVETEEEMERLLASTDPALVFLGPDTGHLAWGGVDPVAFFRRHLERIKTAHLKDISAEVRRRGVAEGWGYRRFADGGIFQELGEGDVDLPGILNALRSVDFDGWVVVETDVTQLPTPRDSAVVSRRYLRGAGL
jgi:inosose dehydratase